MTNLTLSIKRNIPSTLKRSLNWHTDIFIPEANIAVPGDNESKISIMENETNPIESLFERAEAYTKTSYELIKLKALDKTSGAASALVSRLCLIAVLFLFIVVVNIGVALWLGEILGKSYYGFFIEAAFYFLVVVVLLLMHSWIKQRVSSSIITQVLN